MTPKPLPPVQCCYSKGRTADAYHSKVWLILGTTKRLFKINLLENFIHYGLDMRQDRQDSPDTLSLLNPWALPYRSLEDELPDAPGRLPKSMRMGLPDVLYRMHQRGFLIFHEEALLVRPRPGHISINSMDFWYRGVAEHGHWKLAPVALHLLKAAKAWLEEQDLFADSGALPWFSLNDDPLPLNVVDQIIAVCASFGAKASISNNAPRDESRKAGFVGPHLMIQREPISGTYWLKQEDRAERHILDAVFAVLEKYEAGQS